jgi:hypothetical protein
MRRKARREWKNCLDIKKLLGWTKPVAAKNLPYLASQKLARQKFTINVAFQPQISPRGALLRARGAALARDLERCARANAVMTRELLRSHDRGEKRPDNFRCRTMAAIGDQMKFKLTSSA